MKLGLCLFLDRWWCIGTNRYSVHYEPHRLNVSFRHPEPAYVDEEYDIIVDVCNADERTFEVALDVLLQPTEIDDAGAPPSPPQSASNS
jgi:hypothetical protein